MHLLILEAFIPDIIKIRDISARIIDKRRILKEAVKEHIKTPGKSTCLLKIELLRDIISRLT